MATNNKCRPTIYRIYCKKTGESYIGQSVNVSRRWRQHIGDLNKGTHSATNLQSDWIRYGADAFEFTVLESHRWCTQRFLNWRERHWIKRLGFYNEKHRGLYQGKWRYRIEEWAKTAIAFAIVILTWAVLFN